MKTDELTDLPFWVPAPNQDELDRKAAKRAAEIEAATPQIWRGIVAQIINFHIDGNYGTVPPIVRRMEADPLFSNPWEHFETVRAFYEYVDDRYYYA